MYDGIIKVEVIRKGDAESSADEVQGIDGWNFVAADGVGHRGERNA